MLLNDPLDSGQTEACAFKFLLPVQPLEGLEQGACQFHVKAGTIVFKSREELIRSLGRTGNGDAIFSPLELRTDGCAFFQRIFS